MTSKALVYLVWKNMIISEQKPQIVNSNLSLTNFLKGKEKKKTQKQHLMTKVEPKS